MNNSNMIMYTIWYLGKFYFDEQLARIHGIRSSEKVFWRKALEIYATSIDYNSILQTDAE